jgi:hypothetical protein
VSERVLACDSVLVFDVARGNVDTFTFTLPARVNVLQVEGEGSAWSRTEAGEAQRIDVKVNHPIEDHYTLSVRYELPIEGELASLTMPELIAENVVRQTGWLGIVARDNVELSPASDTTGYTRVDLSELPGSLMSLAANPILLAYRQNQGGGTLSLDVHKLADVAVRPATIDSAQFTTLLTKEGSRMTRATYEVRNNVQQHLRVRIAPRTKISSASVGGQLVKPARDEKDADTILVPLLQSAVQGRQLGAFPVEIVYTEAGQALPKGRASLQLALPAADLPIGRASWEIWVPATHSAIDAKGDLDADSPEMLGYVPADSVEQARRTPKGTREAPLHRLREGIERFLITDINNPAGSAGGGGPRYVGAPIQEPESGAAVAGILPVAVQLPLEGVPYAFNRVLIDEQKPLTLTLALYETAAAKRIVAVQFFVALVAGAALGRVVVKRRMSNYILAILTMTAFLVLAAYGYRCGLAQWKPWAYAGVLGFLIAIVPPLVPRELLRRAKRSAQPRAISAGTE